jgi:ribosomal protein S18 acetylase RimI-like enzyme
MKVSIRKSRSPLVLKSAASFMSKSSPWTNLGIDYKACLKTLKYPSFDFYAAFVKKELAGFILIENKGLLKGYIKVLCVSEKFRGQGVGQKLMEKAEEIIFSYSPNVFLCVSSFNKKAKRFYERLGYKRVGILKDFLIKGADEYLLRKTKGPRIGY